MSDLETTNHSILQCIIARLIQTKNQSLSLL